MEVTRKTPARPPEVLSIDDVLKRISLLRRIVRDVVDSYENFRKAKERLDELAVIARKFSSPEIEETVNRLRREVVDYERAMEAYEKEIRDLGGILKDRSRGLAYFYSERDNRKIYLIWELKEPDLLSWHELDETFSDRVPVELPEGARASAGEFPESE